jgi:hypothetical protein
VIWLVLFKNALAMLVPTLVDVDARAVSAGFGGGGGLDLPPMSVPP